MAEIERYTPDDRRGIEQIYRRTLGNEAADRLRLRWDWVRRNPAAGVEPPYILVGQSFGGVYNRVFASLYPHDVVGLVLLDPSQEDFIEWMTIHHPDRQISRKDVVGWPEGAGIWDTLQELKTAGPLPDVPTVVVTGARLGDDPLRREILPVWIRSHAAFVNTRPQGRHYLSHQSGHGVHVEAPDLVVKIIREMVQTARRCEGGVAATTNAVGGDL